MSTDDVTTGTQDTDLPQTAKELDQDMNIVEQLVSHRLQQDDINRILETLSRHDRGVFTDKLAEILRKTSALLEVSRRASDSLSLDVLLPRMVEIISEFLQAERCTLFLHDAARNELYSRVMQGEATSEIRFPAHLGIAGAVFAKGEAEIIADAYADPRFNKEFDKKTGYVTRNILCAPIRGKDGFIGVAQVLNKKGGDFSQADLQLLLAITAQAASAFMNAQLHEQIARARAEEQKLLEVTSAISKELSLEPLLQRIMDTVTEILNADRSTLFMYDKKRGELWSSIAQGVGRSVIRFPSHLGIAGSSFTKREVINIPDAYADERFNKEVDKKTGYKTDNMLCMPIINKQDEAIGVAQVLNKRGGPFTEDDERRLRAFTAQAAIAIENAKLFEDVVSVRNYNESILQSMTNGVITVDADNVLVKANLAALRLFRAESAPQTLEGQPAATFFGDKNAWVLESIARVAESQQADITLDKELVLRAPDATNADERRRAVASVNLQTVPLKDAKGQPVGCMLLLEDLTTEKRLRGTMARYMTKEVADKLLSEGEGALGGQMQRASVLFTDIRSFTTISEKLGPAETVKMLNEYFGIMVDIILGHGGILDKYIGDAMMCVFGAPFSSPEDADNSVNAAVQMLRALRDFNQKRAEAGQAPVLMGLGINTDEVLSGNIGSEKRMDYTVIGDGVNLASRLEGANKYYGTQILVSEFTLRDLKSPFRTREVDRIRVKGKNEPVGVFEVLDHYDEQEFPNMEEVLYLYGSGLEHYKGKDFATARHIFDEVLLLNSKDELSRMYRDRCQHLIDEPPAPDWDGVWTMKDK